MSPTSFRVDGGDVRVQPHVERPAFFRRGFACLADSTPCQGKNQKGRHENDFLRIFTS